MFLMKPCFTAISTMIKKAMKKLIKTYVSRCPIIHKINKTGF